MLLQNAFATLGRDAAVPGALGINEEPRPADTDAKAAGLGPHDGEIQLGAPALEIVPGRLPLFARRAIGTETEKEVSRRAVDAGDGETLVNGGEFGHYASPLQSFRLFCRTHHPSKEARQETP